MRYLALLCLCVAVEAQEPPVTPLSRLREQYREIMDNVYKRPAVIEFCEKNPEGMMNVRVNGDAEMFLVDCVAWKAHKALTEAGVR